MNKRELYEIFENMIDMLGEEGLLSELFNSMSSDELEDNLTYIADNHDMSYLYEKYK